MIRGFTNAQIAVAAPAAVEALSGQQILVKDSGGSISFLGGGQWADDLPSLIQARLIYTFENSSQIRTVSRPGSGPVADFVLSSELRHFEIEAATGEAVAQISAKLVNDQGRITQARIFTARIPVSTIDAASATNALDLALSQVMLDVVRWVSGSRLPRRQESASLAETPAAGL